MSKVFRIYSKLPGSGWWRGWTQYYTLEKTAKEMEIVYGQGNCAVRAVECDARRPFRRPQAAGHGHRST